MSKNSQLLVIVFISTAQLALTLLAIAWLFGWLNDRTHELAQRQVNDVNRFVSEQVSGRFDEMTLNDVHYDDQDWHILQDYIKTTSLPDNGFISVIDSSSGKILCHSNDIPYANLIGKTWDNFVINPDNDSLVDSILNVRLREDSITMLDMDHSTHVVQGKLLSNLGVIVLTHQRISGVHSIYLAYISSLRSFTFAVALIIGLLGTVLNIFMVKKIVDADSRVQISLERLVDKRTDELVQTKNAIIFGLAKLAESRDNDTGQHLDRIRKYVTILARDLANIYEEIDSEFIFNLGIASSLHDIGKVGIPDSILLKPGKLTSQERSVMEKHAVIGGECLEAIGNKLGDNDFLEMAREVAYWHHEHWDGGGYPHKLADDQIPVSARIVAVADVYDALTSRRPYKRGLSHTESRAIILGGAGQQFDPEVIAAFLRHESEFRKIARRYQNVDIETPVSSGTPSQGEIANSTSVTV